MAPESEKKPKKLKKKAPEPEEEAADEPAVKKKKAAKKREAAAAGGELGEEPASKPEEGTKQGKKAKARAEDEASAGVPSKKRKVEASEGEAAETDASRDKKHSKGPDAGKKGKGKGKEKGKGKGNKGEKGEEGKTSSNWSNPKFRVFVHNLDPACDEAMLRKDFTECGELADVYLPTDKTTGKTRGFAFVTFKDMAGVEAALEYDQTDYCGRTLKVKQALDKGQKPEAGSGASLERSEKPAGCSSVVCKRLAPQVTQKDLEDFFSDCGSGPLRVGLLCDKATGKSRCTARVDFHCEEDLDEAMSKEPELRGRTFVMNYCKPKS